MTPSTRRALLLSCALYSGWALYQRAYPGSALSAMALFLILSQKQPPARGRGRSLQRRVRSLSAPPRVRLPSPKQVAPLEHLEVKPLPPIALGVIDLPPPSDPHLTQLSALPQRTSSLFDPLLAFWKKRSDDPEMVDGVLDLRMATSLALDWRPLFGTSPLLIELGDIEGAAQRSIHERRIVITEDQAVANQICRERSSLAAPFVIIGRIGQLRFSKIGRIDIRSPSTYFFFISKHLASLLQEGGELRLIFKANALRLAQKWREKSPLFENSQPVEERGGELHLIHKRRSE